MVTAVVCVAIAVGILGLGSVTGRRLRKRRIEDSAPIRRGLKAPGLKGGTWHLRRAPRDRVR